MTQEPTQEPGGKRIEDPSPERAPSVLTWPFRRAWWFAEKHFLWPLADSFRRISNAVRYRSPLLYIGATAMVCITAGAVAAAVYFYKEAEDGERPAVVAEVPVGNTVIAPATPAEPVPATDDTDRAGPEPTLQGVAPDFSNSSGDAKERKKGDRAVVKPSAPPDAPPLKVAHRFAETFVDYEVGEKKARRELRRTATPKLTRALRSDPPRLPSSGRVPKARVMNVVRGKRDGDRMEVSVALIRAGAASELRLALTKSNDGWLVSEVRG